MIGVLAAGIALGLAGSLHCAAMCGPLTLLVRRHSWLHHAGRIATYLILGGAAGLGGSAIASAGSARTLSVVAGATLVLAALGPRWLQRRRSARPGWLIAAFGAVGHWRSQHDKSGALAFGVLNGLLPCGLVYAAAGAAVSFGDALSGAAFMAAFGFGSTPALLAVRWVSAIARSAPALRLRPAAPIVLALLGVLLVVRGLWPDAAAPDHAAHETTQITSR